MEHSDIVARARVLALDAHKTQKYGDEPYSVHLEAVAELARPFGPSVEAIAWLHDAVEDTDLTVLDIIKATDCQIGACVDLVTDEPGENRKARKAATYKKLSSVVDDTFEAPALIVKVCDRLANVRSCKRSNPGLLKMYRKEHEAFRKACYRPGLCELLWSELDALLT